MAAVTALERLTAVLDGHLQDYDQRNSYRLVRADDLEWALARIAALEAVAEAAVLPRNVAIHDEDTARRFKGEWVAVPREDFVALQDALEGSKP